MNMFEKKEIGIPRHIIERNANNRAITGYFPIVDINSATDEPPTEEQGVQDQEEQYRIVNQNITYQIKECCHDDEEEGSVTPNAKLQKLSLGAVIIAQAVNIFMRVFNIINDIDPKDTK